MFGYEAKAPELVCVAIGVNLLFPVAPVILGKLLFALETDVDKLFKLAPEDQQFLAERDVAELHGVCDKITDERERCKKPAVKSLRWEISMIAAGVVLLWTGLVEPIGGWSIVLFIPGIVAVSVAWRRFCRLRDEHANVVSEVKKRIEVRMEDAKSKPLNSQEADSLATVQKDVSNFRDSREQESSGK